MPAGGSNQPSLFGHAGEEGKGPALIKVQYTSCAERKFDDVISFSKYCVLIFEDIKKNIPRQQYSM